jgi:excisionase family DNA binding protein
MRDQPDNPVLLLTAQEAAERKRVSLATVYKAVRDGKLASVRSSGRLMFADSEVARWSPSTHGGPRRRRELPAELASPRRTLQKLVRAQGVQPISDPVDLSGDFGSLGPRDFLDILEQWRSER